jgi:hypothetical protein
MTPLFATGSTLRKLRDFCMRGKRTAENRVKFPRPGELFVMVCHGMSQDGSKDVVNGPRNMSQLVGQSIQARKAVYFC